MTNSTTVIFSLYCTQDYNLYLNNKNGRLYLYIDNYFRDQLYKNMTKIFYRYDVFKNIFFIKLGVDCSQNFI